MGIAIFREGRSSLVLALPASHSRNKPDTYVIHELWALYVQIPMLRQGNGQGQKNGGWPVVKWGETIEQKLGASVGEKQTY